MLFWNPSEWWSWGVYSALLRCSSLYPTHASPQRTSHLPACGLFYIGPGILLPSMLWVGVHLYALLHAQASMQSCVYESWFLYLANTKQRLLLVGYIWIISPVMFVLYKFGKKGTTCYFMSTCGWNDLLALYVGLHLGTFSFYSGIVIWRMRVSSKLRIWYLSVFFQINVIGREYRNFLGTDWLPLSDAGIGKLRSQALSWTNKTRKTLIFAILQSSTVVNKVFSPF